MIRKWVRKANQRRIVAQEISLSRQHIDMSKDFGIADLLTWSADKRTSEDAMDSIAPVGSTNHMQSAFLTKSSQMESPYQTRNSKMFADAGFGYSMWSTASYLGSGVARELYTSIRAPGQRRPRKPSRGVVSGKLLIDLKRTRPLLGAMEEQLDSRMEEEPLSSPDFDDSPGGPGEIPGLGEELQGSRPVTRDGSLGRSRGLSGEDQGSRPVTRDGSLGRRGPGEPPGEESQGSRPVTRDGSRPATRDGSRPATRDGGRPRLEL
jgi:hypothetical protein